MKKSFGSLHVLVFAAAAALFAGQAQAATTAYTSFTKNGGSDHDFVPHAVGSAADHQGYLTAGSDWLASSFVALAPGSLDHIDVGIGVVAGTHGAIVTLVSDNGGLPNGASAQLET